MDALSNDSVVPSYVDPTVLIQNRLAQVSDLIDVIHRGGREQKPRTAMQRLPRHMRRRAMSHKLRRLPREQRRFAERAVAAAKHRKKAPSRMQRRRPSNLQKEYARRGSGETRWLSTHIWHAKRFEMMSLWGYKLPLRSYQRGVRPLMRTLSSGTILFDDSYIRIMRFRFDNVDRYQAFRSRYETIKTNECHALHACVLTCSENSSNYDSIVAIHPMFLDKPLALLGYLCDCELSDEAPNDAANSKLRAEYSANQPLEVFYGDSCRVTNESNLYALFSFYGANTLDLLYRLIDLVPKPDLEPKSYKHVHEHWNEYCTSGASLDALENGTSFTLLAEDPRLRDSPARRATIEDSTAESSTQSLRPTVNAPDLSHQSCLLFDWRRLTPLLDAEMNEKRLNAKKSKSVGPVELRRYKIPLLVSVWNWCTTQKTTLLMPTRAARPYLSLLYRGGCRVGSLADRFRVSAEKSDCSYPFVWMPLKLERKQFKWQRYNKPLLTPSDAYMAYSKAENWTHIIDNPKTLARLQATLDSRLDNSVIKSLENSSTLVPVRLLIKDKGTINDASLIFALSTSSDVVSSSRSPIGFIVHAVESLLRGQSEAIGYVEARQLAALANSRGRVEVLASGSDRAMAASARCLYC